IPRHARSVPAEPGGRRMNDNSELRRLAEAATPGEWKSTYVKGHAFDQVFVENVDLICDVYGRTSADAAYIAAANPARILALLDEVEALKRERDKWKAHVVVPQTKEIEYYD
ncbi:MAG: ead/Ea22-like family protein, partial [bacterium]